MSSTNYPFNKIEFDFKRERKSAEQLIRERLDPICTARGYVWTKGNWWFKDFGWCRKHCSLNLRTVGYVKQPEVLGGGGLFLEAIHRQVIHRVDFDGPLTDRSTTMGAPIYSLDKRLSYDSGHFNSFQHLKEILPAYERAMAECVLPELERYQSEDDLLQALLEPDWLTSVKLFASQDRRGAVVAMMRAKRNGANDAVAWARAEVDHIKAEKPLVTSTARYQELLRTISYLEQSSVA